MAHLVMEFLDKVTLKQCIDGLADSYVSLVGSGFAPGNEAYRRAKEAALKALELGDTLAEVHSSLAYVKSIWGLSVGIAITTRLGERC